MRGKEQRNLWWFWFDESVKQEPPCIIKISSDEMNKLTWAACTLPVFNSISFI